MTTLNLDTNDVKMLVDAVRSVLAEQGTLLVMAGSKCLGTLTTQRDPKAQAQDRLSDWLREDPQFRDDLIERLENPKFAD
jgi:hypothetical protein